jgi:hypothetical protein
VRLVLLLDSELSEVVHRRATLQAVFPALIHWSSEFPCVWPLHGMLTMGRDAVGMA